MFGKPKEKKLKQETINLNYGHLLFIFKPVSGKKNTDFTWKLKLLNQLEPKIKYSLVIKNSQSIQIIQEHFDDFINKLKISNPKIAQYIETEIRQIDKKLMDSAKEGSTEIVKLLLKSKYTNPTKDGNVALRCAAQNRHHEIVKLLLSDSRVCEQSEPQFVMEWAIRNEYDELVKYLLDENYVGSVAHNNTLVNLVVQIDNARILKLLLTNLNFVINEPIDLFSLVLQNISHRQNPLIRCLLADSRFNPLVSNMDFDHESLDDDRVVVLSAFIKIKCPLYLCGSVREFIDNDPAFAPELAKLFLYFNHKQGLTDALIKLIFERATASNNQRFLQNIQTFISSISLLFEAGVRSESLYDAVFRNPKKALIIARAFVIFHQINFLNQYLVDKIIVHAEQAKDLSLLFVLLKNIGLLANQSDELRLFKLVKYATPLIATIEILSKSDLLIAMDYDIELMFDRPLKRIINKIIISQSQKLICHFDENGKVTEIMRGDTVEQLFKDLQLHYLLTKKVNQNEILNHSVDYKILIKIYQLVANSGCKTRIDNRATNFEMLCNNVEHLEPGLAILQQLYSVNLLTQSTLNSIFTNIQHVSVLTTVFSFLTYFRQFSLEQCNSLFIKAKYAEELASALQCLEYLRMNCYNNVCVLCNCPENAQNIVSILYNLKQTTTELIGENNLIAIEKNAKYAANILSACCALKEKNKLNQHTFDLLMTNPKRAITTALENGGIMVRGNDGLTDFAKTCVAVNIMKSKKFFWDNENPANTIPDEVARRIIELAGDDCFDAESRDELIKSFF